MREIKFRAWDGRQMCDVTELSFFHGAISTLHTKPKGSGEYARSITDTPLMQHIGLKDKNGKDIYEGDIVKSEKCDNPGGFIEWCIPNTCYVVKEVNGTLVKIDVVDGTAQMKKTTVIGNIYENPDLIH